MVSIFIWFVFIAPHLYCMEKIPSPITYKVVNWVELKEDEKKTFPSPIQEDGMLILKNLTRPYNQGASIYYGERDKIEEHSGYEKIMELLGYYPSAILNLDKSAHEIDSLLKKSVKENLNLYRGRSPINFRLSVRPPNNQNQDLELFSVEADGFLSKVFLVNNSLVTVKDFIDLSSLGNITNLFWYNRDWILIRHYSRSTKNSLSLLFVKHNKLDLVTFGKCPFKINSLCPSPFEKHIIIARAQEDVKICVKEFFIKFNIVTKKYTYLTSDVSRLQFLSAKIMTFKDAHHMGIMDEDVVGYNNWGPGEVHLPLVYMKTCLDKNIFQRETFIEDCLREYKNQVFSQDKQ